MFGFPLRAPFGHLARVDVHPDHVVAGRSEVSADPAGAAAGVENPRAAGGHRVDQAGFAHEILTGASQCPKPFDVPLRVARIGFDFLHPQALLDHASIVASPSCTG